MQLSSKKLKEAIPAELTTPQSQSRASPPSAALPPPLRIHLSKMGGKEDWAWLRAGRSGPVNFTSGDDEGRGYSRPGPEFTFDTHKKRAKNQARGKKPHRKSPSLQC
jgi:hypothetical protein